MSDPEPKVDCKRCTECDGKMHRVKHNVSQLQCENCSHVECIVPPITSPTSVHYKGNFSG